MQALGDAAVDVQSDANGGVPEPFLHHLRMHPGSLPPPVLPSAVTVPGSSATVRRPLAVFCEPSRPVKPRSRLKAQANSP